MTVDDWVFEAVEKHGKSGATVREVQRYIDEHRYEELAVDTITQSLQTLTDKNRLTHDETHWYVAKRTSQEDALKKLFGE